MGNNTFYTKGDREKVLSRIGQVHTITMFCPLMDTGVSTLKDSMSVIIPRYRTDDNLWEGVPAIDALNVFIFTATCFKGAESKIDPEIVSVISSSLRMFNRLKYINFKFTDDPEVYETYQMIIQKQKVDKSRCIYKIESLELDLSDMFSQNIIDIFNKVMILNELMPNSYLERVFRLDFTYDEYESFIEMFIGNNNIMLNTLDVNICDYFKKFPPLVEEQKPAIIVMTNYAD